MNINKACQHMKTLVPLLFLLVAFAQSANAETFTVTDGDGPSDVVVSSEDGIVQGEAITKLHSSGPFKQDGMSDADDIVGHGHIVDNDSGDLIVTDQDSDDLFYKHGLDGKRLTFQNSPHTSDNDTPGTPNTPVTPFVAVPEPSTWALLVGSLAGLAILRRNRSRVPKSLKATS
jgi:hypothetical protein